jgi:hypothetical protein
MEENTEVYLKLLEHFMRTVESDIQTVDSPDVPEILKLFEIPTYLKSNPTIEIIALEDPATI